jgi:hypothetical protein
MIALQIALFLSVLFPAAAQTTLSGRVLDVTGSPIEGARITTAPATFAASSNPMGDFSLVLDPGSYTLQVTKDGFANKLPDD